MKSVGLRAAIGLAALTMLGGAAGWGDHITLKDGTELECKVVGYDNGLFAISALDIATNIPAANIVKIRFAPGGAAGAGQSGHGSDAGDEAKKKFDVNELEWVKTALALPKAVETNPRAIMANRVDLAGQLVKVEIPCRSEIRQLTDKIYSVRLGEISSSVGASFCKDGIAYVQKIPDHDDPKTTKTFTVYGVVLTDQMKRDLFAEIWQVGDLLILGRAAKKGATGKTTYAW